MFTLRSRITPRALYKFSESWPFTIDTPSDSTDTNEHPLEQGKQVRVLSPLLSYIAVEENPQYHIIASLVAQKTEQITHIASKTLVLVDKEHVSVLSILAHATRTSSENPYQHWSVEGHQAINGLKKFAKEELTTTKLKSL